MVCQWLLAVLSQKIGLFMHVYNKDADWRYYAEDYDSIARGCTWRRNAADLQYDCVSSHFQSHLERSQSTIKERKPLCSQIAIRWSSTGFWSREWAGKWSSWEVEKIRTRRWDITKAEVFVPVARRQCIEERSALYRVHKLEILIVYNLQSPKPLKGINSVLALVAAVLEITKTESRIRALLELDK